MFFSKEKNQKTFTSCASGQIQNVTGNVQPAQELKVFCFFFSKKSLAHTLFTSRASSEQPSTLKRRNQRCP
jgi:hypothetical protein